MSLDTANWCFFLKAFSPLSALHSHAGRQGYHFSSEIKALMLTDLWGDFLYCCRQYLDLFLPVAGFPCQSLWNISFYFDSLLSRAQVPCLLYWGHSGTAQQPNLQFDCTAAQKGVGISTRLLPSPGFSVACTCRGKGSENTAPNDCENSCVPCCPVSSALPICSKVNAFIFWIW